MKEEMLFKQMFFVRKRTIALDATTEVLADMMPDGVKNTVRWNFGHIFLSQETLLYPFIEKKSQVPETYFELFEMNTSPAEWKTEPPTLQELREHLAEQPNRVMKDFSGRLDAQIMKPFKLGDYEITTLGELLSFAIWHEGLHQGAINTIKRAVGTEDLWSR